jgi:hypothetical protein
MADVTLLNFFSKIAHSHYPFFFLTFSNSFINYQTLRWEKNSLIKCTGWLTCKNYLSKGASYGPTKHNKLVKSLNTKRRTDKSFMSIRRIFLGLFPEKVIEVEKVVKWEKNCLHKTWRIPVFVIILKRIV